MIFFKVFFFKCFFLECLTNTKFSNNYNVIVIHIKITKTSWGRAGPSSAPTWLKLLTGFVYLTNLTWLTWFIWYASYTLKISLQACLILEKAIMKPLRFESGIQLQHISNFSLVRSLS